MILVTDGNQTQGNDYVYSFPSNAVVFPVIVGDTTKVEDLKINQVNVNKYAFLKNKFPIEIYAQYSGEKSINATISISENETTIYRSVVSFSGKKNIQTINALLEANTVGLKKYKISISSGINEKNKVNNTKFVAIEVLDQRKEIALIASITHPDLGAIKRSIESNQQRKVVIVKPQELNSISNFDVCIFYQPTQASNTFIKQAQTQGINLFFITGKSTDYAVMNQFQSQLTFKMSNQKENFIPNYSSQFSLFSQEDISFNNFPPLENAFGTIKTNENVAVLLESKINNIATNMPLLCFSENGQKRIAFLIGENIWKWRVESHVQ
ncbi:MAG TPA: hypothetical protein DDZ41_11740, partial [Flavobacterium sp.]|nr:hypothetical protein [Flavobacterium sp.]